MIPENIINDFIQKLPLIKQDKSNDYLSKTRDTFDARLITYTNRTKDWLFSAVIGELGANTFDHNFFFRPDVPKGIYCDFESKPNYVFMCDFGSGLLKTLSRVVKEINNDIMAMETAFTKPISGRAPEMRGNELKFVISSIVENNWHFYFQSGNAVCEADKNGFCFKKSSYNHNGCFCILASKED